MKLTNIARINYAPITAVLFSLVCWLALYAVYANFGQRGFELLQRPDIVFNAQGVLWVGLHAMGLSLLMTCVLGAIAVLVKSGVRNDAQGHPSKMQHPL
jgi:hypothetical protein